jgi:ABC-type uncharacterized transport system substrate-binding protein
MEGRPDWDAFIGGQYPARHRNDPREATMGTSDDSRHTLPAVYPGTYFVTSGGLISYSADSTDPHRRAAGYVDRILKGEKPANLPVQNPVKYELAVNLKTAKVLGFKIPDRLLAIADEVIE